MVMLRLAVAVTNCVRAEGAGSWDILDRTFWAEADKVPGRGRAVNDARKTALSRACAAVCDNPALPPNPGRQKVKFAPGIGRKIPTNRRLFSVYRMGRAGSMMTPMRRL